MKKVVSVFCFIFFINFGLYSEDNTSLENALSSEDVVGVLDAVFDSVLADYGEYIMGKIFLLDRIESESISLNKFFRQDAA
jgi:hypothetical protein